MAKRDGQVANRAKQSARRKILAGQPSLARLVRALRTHLPEISARYKVKSLGVFGSFVRREEKPRSDLDILVDFSETPGLFEEIELQDYLSNLLGVKVDLVPRQQLKPYIGKRILNEVVWLHGGDSDSTADVRQKANMPRQGRTRKREYLDYLYDLADEMGKVERFVAGLTYEQFREAEITVAATTRAVEMVSVAAKRIPYDVRRRYPQVSWKDVAGMWKKVARDIFNVDRDALWRVATEFIPPLKPLLARVLEEETRRRQEQEAKESGGK